MIKRCRLLILVLSTVTSLVLVPILMPAIADDTGSAIIVADGKLITFEDIEFKKKGDKFTLTIKNVDIQDKGAALTWTTRIGTDSIN